MYKLNRGNELIDQSATPIVWTESELAWYVVTSEMPIYYCDPMREMTVTEVTEP